MSTIWLQGAKHKLTTRTYQGEGCRWNFGHYIKANIDQHHILEGLKDHGYPDIYTRSKVCYLLDGIKLWHLKPFEHKSWQTPPFAPSLIFDAWVTLFKDYIMQKDAGPKKQSWQSTISSAFKTKEDKNGDESGDADMTVEDRYYSREEYSMLSTAKRARLSLKCNKRGHHPGDPSKKGPKK